MAAAPLWRRTEVMSTLWAALPKLRPQRGPAVDSSTLGIIRLGRHGKAQAPLQAWSRIEGSIWIPGHNPRSHIGHLILTLALGPRSGTEKGAPSPFPPPPCLCRCLGSRQFGPWKNTLSRYYNQNLFKIIYTE